jgi:ferredoxin
VVFADPLEGDALMKASVDPQLCQGHARCWSICPEVFHLDEEGHSYVPVPEVPVELEAKAREAADNCPERAITVE